KGCLLKGFGCVPTSGWKCLLLRLYKDRSWTHCRSSHGSNTLEHSYSQSFTPSPEQKSLKTSKRPTLYHLQSSIPCVLFACFRLTLLQTRSSTRLSHLVQHEPSNAHHETNRITPKTISRHQVLPSQTMCKCSFVEYVCSCTEHLCAHLIPGSRHTHPSEAIWQTEHIKWAYCPSFLWTAPAEAAAPGDGGGFDPTCFQSQPRVDHRRYSATSRPASPVVSCDLDGHRSVNCTNKNTINTWMDRPWLDRDARSSGSGSSCSRDSSPVRGNTNAYHQQHQGQNPVFENPRRAPHAPQDQHQHQHQRPSQRESRLRALFSTSAATARAVGGGAGGAGGRGLEGMQLAVRPSQDDRHGGRVPDCEHITYEGWRVRRTCQFCVEFMIGRRDAL
ncbi:hypothetical protein BD289DRAFT_168389, partial [Coniella lustricola]